MRAESLGIDYDSMKERAAQMLKDNEAAVAAAQAKDTSGHPLSSSHVRVCMCVSWPEQQSGYISSRINQDLWLISSASRFPGMVVSVYAACLPPST